MCLLAADDPNIPYPVGQNTHHYEETHCELYGVLIDELDKQAIEKLGKRLGGPSMLSPEDFHLAK